MSYWIAASQQQALIQQTQFIMTFFLGKYNIVCSFNWVCFGDVRGGVLFCFVGGSCFCWGPHGCTRRGHLVLVSVCLEAVGIWAINKQSTGSIKS